MSGTGACDCAYGARLASTASRSDLSCGYLATGSPDARRHARMKQEPRGERMSAEQPPATRRARGSAREARQRERALPPAAPPYLTRSIPPYELLSAEGLEQVEQHADQLLEEIGLEVRGDAEAIGLWRQAGARISG